jgi:hypothetical protein
MIGLQDKAGLYLKLVRELQGPAGFISHESCDSLLFTSLAVCGGLKADLWAAHGPKGWHRRPLSLPECCPDNSKSSISRDMLLGVLLAAYATGNPEMARSVVRQMQRGIMGDYVGMDGFSRVLPAPGLYATARLLVDKLEGRKLSLWRLVPPVDGGVRGGFLDHLSGLHLALRCLIKGSTSRRDREILENLLASNPFNPLFVALNKPASLALDYLALPMLWPADRLPSGRDRKAPWLPERDVRDYAPDPDSDEIHSGMDFNFLLWLVLAWSDLGRTS